MVLLSITSKDDLLSLSIAFDQPYTQNDYRLAVKTLYPNFYLIIDDVLKTGPPNQINNWESIYMEILNTKPGEKSDIIKMLSSGEDVAKNIDMLTNYVLCVYDKGILPGIFSKIVIKHKYTYLYEQIKNFYTLEQFGHCMFHFMRASALMYDDYMKTGNINNISRSGLSEYASDLTILALALRDGMELHRHSVDNLLERIYRHIKIGDTGPPVVLKSLKDFLSMSNYSKEKLKQLVDGGMIGEHLLYYKDVML